MVIVAPRLSGFVLRDNEPLSVEWVSLAAPWCNTSLLSNADPNSLLSHEMFGPRRGLRVERVTMN